MKHLSSVANELVLRCAIKLETSVDELVNNFELEWKPELGEYSRRFVEFCTSKAITKECEFIEPRINDGSFSRFTFDAMLAWEMPSFVAEETRMESKGKELEERKLQVNTPAEHDEIPLFYSDIMPLLVNDEPSVGEDSFVWLASLVRLVGDVVNGRFTFETLTASTGSRLFYPAYDKFLKEIDNCIKNLQKHAKPKGVELADDEFILHVDGTATSQRVVRHIGGTSWPGRLTLTNYALYFEASGAVTYEDALKIDLSKDINHTVKAAATGPWGVPLFDKATVYESPELSEAVVLEFPEITSSTRRDHWLALIKEIMLMHQFLSKYNVESPLQEWEMHARTILGIVRLHAAREMLRISPPSPTRFLIFALFDELPKGDYVLQELAESLKNINSGHPCSASSVLRCLNTSLPVISTIKVKEMVMDSTSVSSPTGAESPLESAIQQVREEAKEAEIAKATTEQFKEEGISESLTVLLGLLAPLKSTVPWFKDVVSWRRPPMTLMVICATMLIIYKEWVGKTIAACLLLAVSKMLHVRMQPLTAQCDEIVMSNDSEQKFTMDSIVSAQHGLKTAHDLVQTANITILKVWSIVCSKTHKHTDMVMMAMSVVAIIFAIVPFKYILMGAMLHYFLMTSQLGRCIQNEQGRRRLKEWWDSIPVIPVRILNKASE